MSRLSQFSITSWRSQRGGTGGAPSLWGCSSKFTSFPLVCALHQISTCVHPLWSSRHGEISFDRTWSGGYESRSGTGTRAYLGFFEMVNLKPTHSKLRIELILNHRRQAEGLPNVMDFIFQYRTCLTKGLPNVMISSILGTAKCYDFLYRKRLAQGLLECGIAETARVETTACIFLFQYLFFDAIFTSYTFGSSPGAWRIGMQTRPSGWTLSYHVSDVNFIDEGIFG